MTKKGISQEMLKLIACVTMLLDHIGATLYPSLELRMIGRISFPIFCFLLSEGIYHTKNPKKYGVRMFLGILLAEIPFDLLFYHRLTLLHQSVMVTLFLGFLYGTIQKKIEKMGHKLLLVLPFLLLAEVLCSDYGGWGIATVAFFVLTRDLSGRWLAQLIGLALINWMIGGARISVGSVWVPIQVLAVFSLIPIRCYRGRKISDARWTQIGFYLFYPLHILALYLLRSL